MWMDRRQMDDRQTDGDEWQVITIAHPEPCSGDLKTFKQHLLYQWPDLKIFHRNVPWVTLCQNY